MNIAIEFIKYSFRAKRRHGVHSPYVYRLQDESFKHKFDTNFLKRLKKLEKEIFHSKEELPKSNFGAGSKRKEKDTEKVSVIAQRSRTSRKYGRLLLQLGEHCKAQNVLELGTNLGFGAAYLSQISTLNSLTSVEGSFEFHKKAKENLEKMKVLGRCTLVNDSFEDYITQDKTVYDLIFIDGDHTQAALFNYLHLLRDNMHDETLVVLDDIRWSKDMLEAWQRIVEDKKFHLSMDFFRLGVVAKRSSQEKEHFILKKK